MQTVIADIDRVIGEKISESFEELKKHMEGVDVSFIPDIEPFDNKRIEMIVQLSRLVDYPPNLQVSLAALHLLFLMLQSPFFEPSTPNVHHLLTFILSNETERLKKDLEKRLEMEEQFEPELNIKQTSITNIIRLQIVTLLIENIPKKRFNLSHVLLGITSRYFEDNEATSYLNECFKETENSLLPTLLSISLYGIGFPGTPILSTKHPNFASKIYELVYVLLSTKKTAKITFEHLSETNFIILNLKYITAHFRDYSQDSPLLYYELLQKTFIFKIASCKMLYDKKELGMFDTKLLSILKGEDGKSLFRHVVYADRLFIEFEGNYSSEIIDGFYQFYFGWSQLFEMFLICLDIENEEKDHAFFYLLLEIVERKDYPPEIESIFLRVLSRLMVVEGIPLHRILSLLSRSDVSEQYRIDVYSLILSSRLSFSEEKLSCPFLSVFIDKLFLDATSPPYVASAVSQLSISILTTLTQHISKENSFHFQQLLQCLSFYEKQENPISFGFTRQLFGFILKISKQEELKEKMVFSGLLETIFQLKCFDSESPMLIFALEILLLFNVSEETIKTFSEKIRRLFYSSLELQNWLKLIKILFQEPFLSVLSEEQLKERIGVFWKESSRFLPSVFSVEAVLQVLKITPRERCRTTLSNIIMAFKRIVGKYRGTRNMLFLKEKKDCNEEERFCNKTKELAEEFVSYSSSVLQDEWSEEIKQLSSVLKTIKTEGIFQSKILQTLFDSISLQKSLS